MIHQSEGLEQSYMPPTTISPSTGLEPICCSIAEGQRLSGLGRSEFYEAIGDGRIEAKKHGSRTLVVVESIRNYLSNLPPYDRSPTPEARAMIEQRKTAAAAAAAAKALQTK
jgi:hypothetical protein